MAGYSLFLSRADEALFSIGWQSARDSVLIKIPVPITSLGCPLKQMDLDRLLQNERTMLHWMCAVKPTDVINTQDLRLRLGIDNLDVALRRKHLRWFCHV